MDEHTQTHCFTHIYWTRVRRVLGTVSWNVYHPSTKVAEDIMGGTKPLTGTPEVPWSPGLSREHRGQVLLLETVVDGPGPGRSCPSNGE